MFAKSLTKGPYEPNNTNRICLQVKGIKQTHPQMVQTLDTKNYKLYFYINL